MYQRLNNGSKDGVHEARCDHLTKFIERLDSLTQETDDNAITILGRDDLNSLDWNVDQQSRKFRHNFWWNSSLKQSCLELVYQLIFDESSFICIHVFSQTAHQAIDVMRRLLMLVDDALHSGQKRYNVVLFYLRNFWIHANVDWHWHYNSNYMMTIFTSASAKRISGKRGGGGHLQLCNTLAPFSRATPSLNVCFHLAYSKLLKLMARWMQTVYEKNWYSLWKYLVDCCWIVPLWSPFGRSTIA